MSLIYNNQIPRDLWKIGSLWACELIWCHNDHSILIKWIEVSSFDNFIERFLFHNHGRKEELFRKLKCPLFSEICRNDKKYFLFLLSPFLGHHNSSFDSLTKSYFICQYCSSRKWRPECKKSRFYLMWVYVHLSISKCFRKFLYSIWRSTECKFMSMNESMVFWDHLWVIYLSSSKNF